MPAMIHLYVTIATRRTSARSPRAVRPCASRRTSSTATARRAYATRPATCGGSPRTWRMYPRKSWRSAWRRQGRGVRESRMRFRKRVKLDPSQVEDYRGQGGGLGGLGGGKLLGGGGGVVGIVVLVLYLVIASQGGGLGQLGSLAGQTVGPGTPNTELATECRTGQDANEREDCRIVAVVNSVQAYWTKTLRRYEPARRGSSRADLDRLRRRVARRRAVLLPPDDYIYIDLGFFDQLKSQLGAEGGPLAEAYILAHEYGHHVQNLTGVLGSRTATPARRAARCVSSSRPTATQGSGSGARSTRGSSRTSPARTSIRRSTRRSRRRRRPDPGASRGSRDARVVDARLVRAAPDMVRPRHRGLRPEQLRHLQGPGLGRRGLAQEREPDEGRHDDPHADGERDADDREPPRVVARRVATVADRPPQLL